MATSAEIQTQIDTLEAAKLKILSAQSYKIGSRSLVRADLAEINRELSELRIRLAIVQNNNRVPGSTVIFGGNLG